MVFNVFVVFVLYGVTNGLRNKNSEFSLNDGKLDGLISTFILLPLLA
jgi:hypothetical protein